MLHIYRYVVLCRTSRCIALYVYRRIHSRFCKRQMYIRKKRAHTYTHSYTHGYTCAHIHTHIYARTHTHTHELQSMCIRHILWQNVTCHKMCTKCDLSQIVRYAHCVCVHKMWRAHELQSMCIRHKCTHTSARPRLLKIIGLFCKRALYKRRYSAKETYNFKKPTNCGHPICVECNTRRPSAWPRQCLECVAVCRSVL